MQPVVVKVRALYWVRRISKGILYWKQSLTARIWVLLVKHFCFCKQLLRQKKFRTISWSEYTLYFTISDRLPEEVQAKSLAAGLPDYHMVQNQKEESTNLHGCKFKYQVKVCEWDGSRENFAVMTKNNMYFHLCAETSNFSHFCLKLKIVSDFFLLPLIS